MKRKGLIFIFSAVFFALLFLFIWNFYPKNLGLFPVLLIMYLLDIYLFWVYRDLIISRSKPRTLLISFIFWLPMLMIIGMAATSIFHPYDDWGNSFKAYYGGFIFIGYVSKLIPLLLILLSDLIKVVRKLFGYSRTTGTTEKYNISRSNFLKKMGILSGGIIFGTLTFGMLKWIHDFKVRKKIIHLPELPSSFNGFRIVQVSDIHLGSWLSKNELKEAVRIINDLNPDVVFFTGDLVNYSTDEAYPFEAVLDKIQARSGVYSILGNHDYGDYKRWNDPLSKQQNMDEMYRLHKRLGWRLLLNENDVIQRGNDQIAIMGVENWGSMKRFQKYGDLEKSFRGTENVPVRLLLSHDPSHFEQKILDFKHTVDVTFSGHTHGAQFGIEVPGMRWSPSQYIYKYWAGLYTERNNKTGSPQHIYVNRGLGAIGYPGRVGILPEITLVELQS